MPDRVEFRPYHAADRAACLSIFDANCPAFFAPNERDDYLEFLDQCGGGYELCIADQEPAGAFGVFAEGPANARLNWIMIHPNAQGSGIGSQMMARARQLADSMQAGCLEIAASHRSAPFFERFGARQLSFTPDGWGAGMHRVDMQLKV